MKRQVEPIPNAPATLMVERFRERGIRPADLARLLKVEWSTVWRWCLSRHDGGTDGLIPARYQTRVLEAARLNRVKLRPADLIPTD